MGNVPSSQLSVFSEKEPELFEFSDQEAQPKNTQNTDTNHANHSAINREISEENIRREIQVEGEKYNENQSLCSVETVFIQSGSELKIISERNREKLHEFEEELKIKQEKRREILAAKKQEMEDLRQQVIDLKEENERLKKISLENEEIKHELNKLKEFNSESEKTETELARIKEENSHLKLLSRSENNSPEITLHIEKLTQENSNLKTDLQEKQNQMEKMSALLEKNKELRISIAEMQSELQDLNKVVVEFEQERKEYKTHVVALKDVINVSKRMLLIREEQLRELRQKVESIEQSVCGNEISLLSQDLRLQYERQLQSIRNLKTLYEERQRSDQREKEELRSLLDETKKELENQQKKNEESEGRIKELEEQNSKNYDEIKSLESSLGLTKAECRQYQAELTVINQLFSEILLGFNTNQEIDLDKITKHLEDHHGLLKEIVINEICPAASSALPKMLLDLLSQINDSKSAQKSQDLENSDEGRLETITEESESQTSSYNINSAQEIVELLPKVWRVLIELLSHQKVPTNILTEEKQPNEENPCYKTVQTPKGPSLVLSVSQTFIRLKDLILEKKALEKETGHLKQLNGHLESRLQDQEKRLEMVSTELNKTWHVVGKLQKQHQLLHTQEKILRYELAQKRKLLSTLKEELEYSREKWQQAREKNSTTEKQWKQLRGEFAARRNIVRDDFSNSVESGYSDEKCSSSDDEVEKGYESDVSECSPKVEDESDVPQSDSKSRDEELCLENKDTTTQIVGVKSQMTENHDEDKNDQDNRINDIPTEITSSVIFEQNLSFSSTQVQTPSKTELEGPSKDNDNTNNAVNFANRDNLESTQTEEATTENTTPKKSVSELIYEELEQLLKNEERLVQIPKNVHSSEEETCTEESKTESTQNEASVSKLGRPSLIEGIWAAKNDILGTKDKKSPEDNSKNLNNNETNYQATELNEEQCTSAQASTSAREVDMTKEKSTKNREKPKRSFDEIMAAKEERLRRLEGQCQQLVDKVTNTTQKRNVISNKLDGLHNTYGEKSSGSKDVKEEEIEEEKGGNDDINQGEQE